MGTATVIITADDLGLWPEVNDAVMAGYDAGVLTSASLRVSASAAQSAIISAAMRPGLGVGLHLVLCEGQATLPRKHVPNLVDSNGEFVKKPLEAVWLYRRAGGLRDELKTEIRGQIEKFLATGLFMTHISGHYHLHLHPVVLSILKELAADYPISAIRKPCGPMWRWSRRYSSWQRTAEAAMMRSVLGWGRLRAGVFRGPDRVEPLSIDKPVTEHGVAERLRSLKSGITELVCHPASLLGRYDGVAEGSLMTSPMVKTALVEADLELASYRDIAEGI
ncbi:MAG: ChbG/HpnK family deacetylase [Deltaproteobacteria bacterium]